MLILSISSRLYLFILCINFSKPYGRWRRRYIYIYYIYIYILLFCWKPKRLLMRGNHSTPLGLSTLILYHLILLLPKFQAREKGFSELPSISLLRYDSESSNHVLNKLTSSSIPMPLLCEKPVSFFLPDCAQLLMHE